MKAFWITTFLLVAPLSPGGRPVRLPLLAPADPMRVALVPLGKVPDADIDVVKRALRDYYQVHVTVTAPLPVPDDAGVIGWTQSVRVQAGQSRLVADTAILQGNRLLTLLAGYQQKGFDKVVGVTPRGIRASREQWTIRGMASETCALLSTYLVRQQSTEETFAFRLTKLARHEFGHVLDLPHCSNLPVNGVPVLPHPGRVKAPAKGNPDCFMHESSPDGAQFYATTNQLCAPCAERVKNHLKPRLSP